MSAQPSKLDIKVEQVRSIYAQFQAIFDEKIALHLPQEQDSVKNEVFLQLQNYLAEAMNMASSSLNIVNANAGTSLPELLAQSKEQFVEPFDLELNEQVRQKYQEWEDQTVRVAQLRREAPQKLCHDYVAEARSALEEADALIASFTESDETSSRDQQESVEELYKSDNINQEDLQADYNQALVNLAAVQAQIPQNRAHVQKLEQLIS